MKTKIQIQSLPDAEPIAGAMVAVRSLATGVTITSDATDTDGFYTLQRDGHLEPYYLYLNGLPGGDKFWRSDEMATAGPSSPWDWPMALMPLGNGVVAGYEGEFAVSVGGNILTILNGAAIVLGHPVVSYFNTFFSVARPISGTRTDRVIIRLYPAGSATTPGKADIVVLAGEDTIGTVPSLTQTTEMYELPLARVAVPSAGTLVVTNERQMLQPERHAPVTDEVIADGPIVTDEAGGEALSGMSITLDLPDEGTYDITTSLSATQGPVAGSTNWTNVATYGPTFNSIAISNPGQVAVDSTGRILIADTGNNRLIRLDSSGSYVDGISGLTGITGVCVDAGNNIMVAYGTTLRRYTSLLAHRWTVTPGGTLRHVASDSVNVYVTDTVQQKVWVRLGSDGTAVTSFGSVGSGNGQFQEPIGIAYYGGELYVVDNLNDRIQVLSVTGTYQREWIPGLTDDVLYGVAIDATGNVWFTNRGQSLVSRFSNTGVAQVSLSIPDAYGIAVGSGDVLWIGNAVSNTIAKWDEVTSAAGYGQLAIEIDGVMGTYVGPGNRDAPIKTVAIGSKAGGYGETVTVNGFAKATSGEATFKSLVLSAEARSRR